MFFGPGPACQRGRLQRGMHPKAGPERERLRVQHVRQISMQELVEMRRLALGPTAPVGTLADWQL
eukprot:1964141-Prorocentrum_lima.AAC.1